MTIFVTKLTPMIKSSVFSQSGTLPAVRPYTVPAVRIIPLSPEKALLLVSTYGDQIEPGIGDDWGDL